ncbi:MULTISPECIES: response regulator transcription factor [Saccharibacillus]|uniref:response regulator transcription factor n=1 Tax=Saccharibacillus TaxID=456492 RepID=UPI00123C4113|nr:response regulator [Saccharibacillus sp. WB 17]MWJ31482.1 response regulator [Saccharibacillus sp. WB 17]
MIEVLLVDDETYVTESLELTIPWEEIGVSTVRRAASGAEALAIMEEEAIDLVVTDIRMPGMDGLQLIEEIGRRFAGVRCILLTGHSDFSYAKKALQLRASDYVLKPVDDAEFVAAVSEAIDSLREEWDEFDKVHRLLYSRKSDYKVLRENLLQELLLGRELGGRALDEQLRAYELPLQAGAPTLMLLARLEGRFASMDAASLELMDFAAGNIAGEVLRGQPLWYGSGPHGCLVLLLQPSEAGGGLALEQTAGGLDRRLDTLREHIRLYLKGEISLAVSTVFELGGGAPTAAYRRTLGSLYAAGTGGRTVYTDARAAASGQAVSHSAVSPAGDGRGAIAEAMYAPPTLLHLLESHQWDEAKAKMGGVFDAAEQAGLAGPPMYEIYLWMTNAFLFISHREGQPVGELGGEEGFDPVLARGLVQHPQRLRSWGMRLLDGLAEQMSHGGGEGQGRSKVAGRIRHLVGAGLDGDLSVKTLADQVYLHPVYLSKIYKAETGEALGDYIIRMRMERAAHLLKHTSKKIYEITGELGYQNPQYFSKMFKKQYGMTPNEFRELS